MKKLRKYNKKGFTLIELLVVVAIIGLLSSVVLISLNSARQKARDAKRAADIRQIASALELYYNDCGSYPALAPTKLTSANSLQSASGTAATTALPCGTNDGTTATPNGNGGIRTTNGGAGTVYLSQFPTAPTPADTAACTVANPGLAGATYNDYVYRSEDSTGAASVAVPAPGYRVYFCLGAQTGGYAAGGHNLSPAGIN